MTHTGNENCPIRPLHDPCHTGSTEDGRTLDDMTVRSVILAWRRQIRGTADRAPALAFDPVPDLAALIDGLHDAATDAREGSFWRLLGGLISGPYARLRGGLLLDEPGCESATTEQAIRTALIQAQAGYRGPFPPESGMTRQDAAGNGILG